MSYMSDIADEIARELPAGLIPDEHPRDLMLLYALLATTLGASVTTKHVHDAWTVWMTSLGEEHESMVPFQALATDVQNEDEPFAEAIRRVAARRGVG